MDRTAVVKGDNNAILAGSRIVKAMAADQQVAHELRSVNDLHQALGSIRAQVVEGGNNIHHIALGSRTEITDAAIAKRAERVMLKQGSNRNRAAGERGSA